jgi:hypothetical protein
MVNVGAKAATGWVHPMAYLFPEKERVMPCKRYKFFALTGSQICPKFDDSLG